MKFKMRRITNSLEQAGFVVNEAWREAINLGGTRLYVGILFFDEDSRITSPQQIQAALPPFVQAGVLLPRKERDYQAVILAVDLKYEPLAAEIRVGV